MSSETANGTLESARRAITADIAATDVTLAPKDWATLDQATRVVVTRAGDCIYAQHDLGSCWLFLASGIVASRQTHLDGNVSIARFFEPGQFCANLTSTWNQEYASDDLIALTDVIGMELPDSVFRPEYLDGSALGRYLRIKVMETLCFDKEVICAKTQSSTESRYTFLEQFQPTVVASVQHKHVAAFLGITPQGLSRFLRYRQAAG